MATEGGFFSGEGVRRLPPILFAVAAFFLFLSFFVGWFSVDTKVEAWEYDQEAEDGKGTRVPVNAKLDTELRMLSLGTDIQPTQVEEAIDNDPDLGLPSYDEEAPRAGSQMLGVLMLHVVAFLSLLGLAGFYAWNRRSRRDYGRTVWRFAALFGIFSIGTILWLSFAVPSAAQTDTREFLATYYQAFRDRAPQGMAFPDLPEDMFRPNISFYKVWICCTPEVRVPYQLPGGTVEVLVQTTTTSKPSGGFGLSLLGVLLTGAGMYLGARAGHLDPKGAAPPVPPLPPPPSTPPPLPPKVA